MDTLNVLVVDDSLDDVHVIMRALKKGGLRVDVQAARNREQFEAMSALDWHIIILDYYIPGLNTLEMLHDLRQRNSDTPIIIVSGQVQVEEAVALMRQGARDFIRKDDLSRLVPAVQRELTEAELRRERRQALHDLKQARDEAEQASLTKTDFLLMLNHELRTPLHGIIGMLNLLLADTHGMTEKQCEYAQISRISANGMCDLMSDMLDISKVESGMSNIKEESFDLLQCLHSAITPFVIITREKGVSVDLICDAMPLRIKSDQSHVHQMIVNLVSNAVKFTERGSITIKAWAISEAQGEMLCIEVCDTGSGMQQEFLNTLFEPYTQSGQTQSQRSTGLGTTLVKRFSELLGGSIRVTSEWGQGSSFTISIPLHRDGDDVVGSTTNMNHITVPTPAQPVLTEHKLVKAKVLLAEDDFVSRTLIQLEFENHGWTLDCAENGLEAWEKVQNNDYDVLLTDLRMPGMDGIELTQTIRAYEKQMDKSPLTIIGLSAHALQEVKEECASVGMDAFVSKPVDVDKVLHLMRETHATSIE